jgi:hypothetical protein
MCSGAARRLRWTGVLATQLGIAAIDLASEGRWGCWRPCGAEVAAAPISEAISNLKMVPDCLYRVAEVFFA